MLVNDIPLPVVFIPALLCDDALYQDVITGLGDSIDTHVLMSPKPNLEDSAADILARAPEKFVLFGASYGGNLALQIALSAPERITKLVLSGCDPAAPQSGGPDLAAGLDTAPEMVIDMLAGLVVKPTATKAKAVFIEMAGRVGGAAGADQARALASRAEVTSRLGELTMPALVLAGAEDALDPITMSRALADALPNAEFHVVGDSGHLPTLEKPLECTAILSEFFQGKS